MTILATLPRSDTIQMKSQRVSCWPKLAFTSPTAMTLLQEAAFPGLTPQSTRDPDFRRAASIGAACAPCAAAWGHDKIHLRAEACSHNRLHRKWRLGCRVSVTSWNFWRPVLGSKSAWVLSYMLSTQCPFWGVSAQRLVQRAPKFGTSVVTQDRTIRCLAKLLISSVLQT